MKGRDWHRRGLTVAELIVSISILAVLGGLGYGALGSARRKANLAEDVAASRRIIQAYLARAGDENGVLPRGRYPEDAIPEVILPDGTPLSRVAQKIVLQRYPWHLASYLGWRVKENYVTWVNRPEHEKALALFGRSPALAKSQYYYLISVQPAFGHNVYGIGGWDGSPTSDAVTRLAQVAAPSQLIVFLSARGNNSSGYSFVEPPFSAQRTYRFDGSVERVERRWPGAAYTAATASEFGYIALPHDEKAVAAFLDGHVGLLGMDELRDSRHWSARAQEADDPRYCIER